MLIRPVDTRFEAETDRQEPAALDQLVAPNRRMAVLVLVAGGALLLAVLLSFSGERVGLFQHLSSDGGPGTEAPQEPVATPDAHEEGGEAVRSAVEGLVAEILSTLPPPEASSPVEQGEGREVVVGNRSTVDIDVEGPDGGKISVTNSGSATADTGGNTVIGNTSADATGGSASVSTGEAIAVGNDASTTVRAKP